MSKSNNLSLDLITPHELVLKYPAKPEYEIDRKRQSIINSIQGSEDKPLLVVGPCSVHDPIAILEYAKRLADLSHKVRHKATVIMRVYVEKPRTVYGWKGYLYDPNLDGSCDLELGLMRSRELMTQIASLDLPIGMEIVNPLVYPYLGDLISWGCVGARTTESQVHREFASSLPIPVGFKNPTSGNAQVAVNSMNAATSGHTFLSTDMNCPLLVRSEGNKNTHIVLRGGDSGPNYDQLNLGIPKNKIMVDCSHGNCEQDYIRQLHVFRKCLKLSPLGLMVESFLVEGKGNLFGQSITDPCLGWEDTEKLINLI